MTEAAGIRGAEWFAAGTASWLSLTRSFRGGAWRTSTGAARRRSLQERPRSRDRRPSPTDRRPRRRVGPEMPLASALPVCRGIAARSLRMARLLRFCWYFVVSEGRELRNATQSGGSGLGRPGSRTTSRSGGPSSDPASSHPSDERHTRREWQGSVRQLFSRYRSRHKVSLPDGRRHTLVSGSTYDAGGPGPVIRLLWPSTQDPDVSDWNFEASSVRERTPSLR